MNESAPITWLINKITTLVESGAGGAAAAIANIITPLASICFGIYIILITINYMRGSETEPVLDFGLRMASFAIVIGMGLNAANYVSMVMPIVTGLGGDLANAISGGTVNASTLDQLALHYLNVINEGFADTDSFIPLLSIGAKIEVFLKAVIIILGLAPFLIAATMVSIIANVGSIMVAMVGPLFFGFLLFPATRQYFSAWVNTAISYALIPVFVAVIAIISVGLSKEMLSDAAGTLNEASFTSVFLASLGNLTLLFLLKQVSAIASSLSAGGINAGMPSSRGMSDAVKNAAGAAKGAYKGAQYVGNKAAAGYAAVKNATNSIRKAG